MVATPRHFGSFCPRETVGLLGKIETIVDQVRTLIFKALGIDSQQLNSDNWYTGFVKYMCTDSLNNDHFIMTTNWMCI